MKNPKPFYKRPLFWSFIVLALLGIPTAIKVFELYIYPSKPIAEEDDFFVPSKQVDWRPEPVSEENEAMLEKIEIAKSENPDGTDDANELEGWKEYRDEELMISFAYPAEWGDISIDHEMGINYAEDSYEANEQVSYELSFTAFEGYTGHFLTANRKGYGPIARGGYWGDLSKDIDSITIIDWCNTNNPGVGSSKCELVENANGIRMIKLRDAVNYFADNPATTTQYLFYVPNVRFSSISISPANIVDFNDDMDLNKTEEIFENIADSIYFIQ